MGFVAHARAFASGFLLVNISGCFSTKKSAEEINKKSSELFQSFQEEARNGDVQVDLADWMSSVQDLKIVELPILPGSHNSASAKPRNLMDGPIFQLARQQEISIADQLSSGVRVLDFRLRFESGVSDATREALKVDEDDGDDGHSHIRLAHTYDTTYRLEKALEEVKAFLSAHPTEFIVILIKADWKPEDKFASNKNKGERVAELASVLKASNLKFVSPSSIVPMKAKVSDVKGQVFLVSDWLQTNPNDEERDLLAVNGIPYFGRDRFYSVCDVWSAESVQSALKKVDAFMKNSAKYSGVKPPEFDVEDCSTFALPGTKLFTGVALDRTETSTPPCVRSKKWTDWFASNLETNAQWRSASNNKPVIGVVLLDFANPALIKRTLDVGFAMAGQPKMKTKFSLDWFKTLDLHCSLTPNE
jgi:hypothetical protein